MAGVCSYLHETPAVGSHSVEPRLPVRIAPPSMVSRSAPEESHVRYSRGVSAQYYITSNDHSAPGLDCENTAVDVDLRTCDVGRLIGNQEKDGVRHLVNFKDIDLSDTDYRSQRGEGAAAT